MILVAHKYAFITIFQVNKRIISAESIKSGPWSEVRLIQKVEYLGSDVHIYLHG